MLQQGLAGFDGPSACHGRMMPSLALELTLAIGSPVVEVQDFINSPTNRTAFPTAKQEC